MWRWFVLICLVGLTACQGLTARRPSPLPEMTATAVAPQPTPEPSATPLPDPYTPAGFDQFLAELAAVRTQERRQVANRYLAQLPATPLSAAGRAIFLWRGQAISVKVVGDMNNWNPDQGLALSQLADTDLWVLATEFEPEARLDYKFYVNGAWQLDPLNPRTVPGGFGPNSELVMPGYQTAADLLPAGVEPPAGVVNRHSLDSLHLNQRRSFLVYQPAAQLVGTKYPSVYFHDGSDYLNLIHTTAILDRLIAARQIPPLVAVFIPPVNRAVEYDRNDAYVAFLADELAPFIQSQYNSDPDPARTATIGASMGGLIALYTAVSRSDVFGLAAGQSGAYALGDDALAARIAGQTVQPARLYLVVGSYETAVGGAIGSAIGGNESEGNILAANRRLAIILRARGLEFAYEERPEGHSWGLWRATLGPALEYLYR
jgi:enterochelin esterase-like enzyme